MTLRLILSATALAAVATQAVAQDDPFAECRASTVGEAQIGGPF